MTKDWFTLAATRGGVASGGERRRDRRREATIAARASSAARGAALLTGATVLTAGSNVVFHLLVARGVGSKTYGAIAALLALGTLASVLASGVQYGVTRRVALGARPLTALARGLEAAVPWFGTSVLVVVLSPAIASYLKIGGVVPVVEAAAVVAGYVFLAVPAGILVGRGRYGLFAVVTVAASVLRLGVVAIPGWKAHALNLALGASAASFAIACLAAVLVIRHIEDRAPTPSRDSAPTQSSDSADGSLSREGLANTVLATSLWGVWMLPLLFARHSLPHAVAGRFSAAQFLCTGVLFLAIPISTAFFPAIAAGRQTRTIAWGFVGTIAVAGTGAMTLIVLGPYLMTHLYGQSYTASHWLFVWLGASTVLTAVGTFFLWVARALDRFTVSLSVAIFTAVAVEVILGVTWHTSGSVLAAGPGIAIATGMMGALLRRRALTRQKPVYPAQLQSSDGAGVISLSSPALAATVVGVMAYNEEATIRPCLEAILAESDGGAGVGAVVVVASGCTDTTQDVVREIAHRDPRLRLIVQSARLGKAAAINAFLEETDHPLCALVSADVLIERGALVRMVEGVLEPGVGMTGGRIVPMNPRTTLAGRIGHALWDLHHRLAMVRPKLGEAIVFRRAFTAIDPTTLADEASIEALVEGTGTSLQYIPGAVVRNCCPERMDDYLAHRVRIHRGHLAIRSSCGYAPASLRTGLLVRVLAGAAVRRPTRLIDFALALAIEMIARGNAAFVHLFADQPADGLWEPIRSAKRSFQPLDLEELAPEPSHAG